MIIHMHKCLQHQNFSTCSWRYLIWPLTQLLIYTLRGWVPVLLYTLISIFIFSHINYDFQWLWTTATKFIWNYSLWPNNILTYMHFITSASCQFSTYSFLFEKSLNFLLLDVRIWWKLLPPSTASTCSVFTLLWARWSPSLLCLLVDTQTSCLGTLPLCITLPLRILY